MTKRVPRRKEARSGRSCFTTFFGSFRGPFFDRAAVEGMHTRDLSPAAWHLGPNSRDSKRATTHGVPKRQHRRSDRQERMRSCRHPSTPGWGRRGAEGVRCRTGRCNPPERSQGGPNPGGADSRQVGYTPRRGGEETLGGTRASAVAGSPVVPLVVG
jgi:hypothetical protein